MKAQVNIEFILSIVIFLSTLIIIGINVINMVPMFHGESVSSVLKSKSYQVSEILLKDEGSPSNWELLNIGEVKRIGLSTGEWYDLDQAKIIKLSDFCSADYEDVKEKFGLEFGMTVIINITYLNDTPVLSCVPDVVSITANKHWTKRFGMLNNEIVKLQVGVY